MRMKKFLTILLTLAMVLSLLPQTAFAANNTATTMRLAKTQGTVTVTNATNKKVTQTANMKLYNGFKLKTGAKSYAWISLDDTKVAKLDANSVVSVQKTGQKLTLYLSSGNLFFNVKETLKSGESFRIKTSTMTTGIRGTSGCVRVINPRVSELHLLTGTVEVHAEHPALNLTKTESVAAGHMATSLIDQEAMQLTGEQVEIIVEALQEHNVCGNCATEIAADPVLQEEIEEVTDLDVEQIVEEAEETLAEDEAVAEEEQAAIEEAEAEQELPEDVDPYFQEEAASGGGGGGSSVTVTTNVVEVTNWQEFVDALTEFGGSAENTEIRLMADIEPDAGVTTMPAVEDNGAALTLNLQEYGLSIPQPLVNNGDLTITNVDGYITAYDFENWTTPRDVVQNYGTLTHLAGQIQMPGGYNGVYNQGTYTLNGGTFDIFFVEEGGNPTSVVQNSGTFYMQAGTVTYPIINDGTATISGGTVSSEIVNNDTMTISGGEIYGTIADNGEMDITGGTFTYHGGTDLMEGSISIASGAELNITGGTFSDEGVLIGNKGGTFNMTGGQLTVSSESANRDIEAYYDNGGGTATIGGSAKISIDVSNIGNYIVAEQLNAIQLAAADAELTMTGGTIEVNGIEEVCGVRVTNGTFEMTGGTIEVNDSGTGVFGGGEIELAGGKITAYEESVAVDLSYGGDLVRPIGADVTWTFATGAGYTVNDVYTYLLTPQTIWDTKMSVSEVSSDAAQMTVRLTDGYGTVAANATVTDVDTFLQAIEAFNNGAADSTITLGADITFVPIENDDGTIAGVPQVLLTNTASTLTIDLAGNSLSIEDAPIEISSGASLKITDSGSGGLVTGVSDPLITNYGTFELAGGTMNPSGKAVTNTGDVVMSGGVINVTADNTYGILTETGGSNPTVTASGGTINVTGNNAIGIGDYEGSRCTTTLSGVVINVGNTTTTDITSRAVETNFGTVNMTNGNINVYSANSYGIYNYYGTTNVTGGAVRTWGDATSSVGIYAYNSETTVEGGFLVPSGENAVSIQVNGGTLTYGAGSYIQTSSSTSTGILLQNSSTATLSGGTIDVYNGTGVQVNSNSTATVSGIAVTVNNEGTGIETDTNGTVIMNSGTITVDAGEGIYTDSGVVKLNGGTINVTGTDVGNTGAATYAHGVSGYGAEDITLNGTTINTATDDCTGIYTSNGSEVTVSDGEVNVSGGYGIRLNSTGCQMTMTDGEINVTTDGNIGIATAGTVQISGGTMTVASTAGTGINVVQGTMKMTDGDITVSDGNVGINNNATVSLKGGTITATGDTAVALNNNGGFGSRPIETVLKATTEAGLQIVDENGNLIETTQDEDGYFVTADSYEPEVVEPEDTPVEETPETSSEDSSADASTGDTSTEESTSGNETTESTTTETSAEGSEDTQTQTVNEEETTTEETQAEETPAEDSGEASA